MSSIKFQRLQCLQSFTLSKDYNVFIYISKTSMSSVIYVFKDYNIFIYTSMTSMSSVIYAFKRWQCLHLHFRRFQCLQSFMLSKTTMSLFTLQDFNVFCLLHFTRIQYLWSFTLYNTSTSCVFYWTQCPYLCAC